MAKHMISGAYTHADGRSKFVKHGAALLASLLLASAGICWVAANWAALSNQTKLVGVQVVLAGLVLAAGGLSLWQQPAAEHRNRNLSWQAHLIALAAVTVGALLALMGQIYQMGADPWQLFAIWAALLLPWLLVQRTIFLCLLFVLVVNMALALYFSIYASAVWWGGASWTGPAMLVALINVVFLALIERFILRLDDPWRITPRLAAVAVSVWLVTAGLMAAGLRTGSILAGPLVAAVLAWLVLGVIYWAYTRVRSDLVIVSMAALAAFIILVWLLLHWVDTKFGLLLVVLLLLLAMFAGVRKLGALLRARFIDQEPWYVSAFRLVALGITALLLMALLMLVLDLQVETLWIPGLGLCLAGVIVYRLAPTGFVPELGMTLATAGLLLSAGSFFVLDEQGAGIAAYAVLMLAVGLYIPITNKVFRLIAAMLGVGLFTLLTWSEGRWFQTLFGAGAHPLESLPIYLRLWWFSVAAVAAFLGGQGRQAKLWRPLAWSLALLAQIIAWQVPPLQWSQLADVWMYAPSLWIVRLACAALPVVVLAAMLWRIPVLPNVLRVGAPLALAVAVAGWMGAPGVSLALLWVVLGRVLHERSLVGFGVAALLIYLARFYYQLDTPLLHKSIVLAATGAWLLVSVWAISALGRYANGTHQKNVHSGNTRVVPGVYGSASPRRPFLHAAGLILGLILVLAVADVTVYKREQIVMHGHRVVLALAPVDPRSLMQGDYMRLDFEVARQVSDTMQHMGEPARRHVQAHGSGLLLLRPDPEGVHRLVEVLPSNVASLPAGVMQLHDALLEFRMRRGAVRIVTDAWFFPEGQAEHFQQARYGEFRVDADGTGLLVNMLDANLRALAQSD